MGGVTPRGEIPTREGPGRAHSSFQRGLPRKRSAHPVSLPGWNIRIALAVERMLRTVGHWPRLREVSMDPTPKAGAMIVIDSRRQ